MEKSIVSDAFDYKGAPADRAKTGGWVSAAMILCKIQLSSVLVGRLADSFLGWYWTILGSCILAISATLPNLRPLPSNPSLGVKCEEASTLQMAVFYIAMYTFGVGVCGVKSSVLFSTRKKKLKWHTSTDSTSSSALEPYWLLQ
ncbi:hypothetical protein VitviT2T_016652 [Vitis vinifera]|uniref:Uncharacterized protein n=1 Tax=Vitis vinifera TaxID=29760 RepID=A0ABY9CSJ6_VITVI|nr:hypothetical protein VitviT2T_016652 [Vitis vinifera]